MASAYKDAQAQNDISRNSQQYSDLDLFFGKRTVGSDVNKVTDVLAVKRSLRNLINLNTFEKPFHPEISGGVRELLFEHLNEIRSIEHLRKLFQVANDENKIANQKAHLEKATVFDPNVKIDTIRDSYVSWVYPNTEL